ncbi:hypothetical protein F2P56_009904 [Juglans regia]|uniref:Uncharacterized protein n=1 Tax=Juglans regia TaxID=51240 RepID=A0A833Y0K3_JUGRE|nr:hypothetical protein F2P56_009904 [Juglans regia]
MANSSRLQWWCNKLAFDAYSSNDETGGKIWVMWKNEVSLVVQSVSEQQMTMTIVEQTRTLLLTFFYARCSYLERRQLWSTLVGLNSSDFPWFVMGDFNIIRHDGERRGGSPRLACAMEEFNSCIAACGLLEMHFSGNSFSWCNGHQASARSWVRLDRSLLNVEALEAFPDCSFTYLSRNTSDHSPMLIKLVMNAAPYGYPSFKFQQMWTSHNDFMEMVARVWKEESFGSGLFRLANKLKRLRVALKTWNKMVFGRTNLHISELEERIQGIESRLQDDGHSVELESDLLASKLELSVWMDREETRLSQQAKQTWLEKGEASSVFFRAVSKQNRHMIKRMNFGNGIVLTSPEQIHMGAIDFFKDFLEARPCSALPDLGFLVDKVVQDEENNALSKIPSELEIHDALWSIPVDSCPGPDGFNSGFFKSCWPIVSRDVIDAVVEFFRGGLLPRFYTASYLVLIPKVENPSSFDKFRPISLCSVIYKVAESGYQYRLQM